MMNEALELLKHNLSVIPIGPDKRPLIKWLPYQEKRPTEDEINTWWKKYPNANVGIVTGKISNLTVIDCDSESAIKHFNKEFTGKTVTVKTPRGIHYYFKYAEGTRNTVKINGLDLDCRSEGGYVVAPPSINDKGEKYAWVSDLDSLALADLSIINSLSLYIGDSTNRNGNSTKLNNTPQNSTQFFVSGSRDNDLFRVANCLIKGGSSIEFARQVLEILGTNCNPPFPENELTTKIKSALDRSDRREQNMMNEVTDFIINSTNGIIYSTEIAKTLQYSTSAEIKHLSMCMKRLQEKKIVEKAGSRNGCWRKVETTYEVMDIASASGKPIDGFRYPLSIEKHARTYPKNVITVNGFANQGKSAFVFEITRMNQKLFPGHKPRFMSSEAGVDEIKEKLMFYPQDLFPLSWWVKNIEFIERHDTWWDIIDPDGLNIIDYISDYQEAYKIPHYINEILKKLNKGVAIVVMQRDPHKAYSQGGQGTRHAARLAIDIEFKKCVLTKVKGAIKHPPDYRHPDGIARRFELSNVWKILPTSEWFWPDEEKETQKKKKYAEYGITPKTKKTIDDEFVKEDEGWNNG